MYVKIYCTYINAKVFVQVNTVSVFLQHVGSADVVNAIIYVFGEPLGSCEGVDGSSGILAGDKDAGR